MITDATNAGYDDMLPSWQMTRRMTRPDEAPIELIQGAYESNSRFEARKSLTDYHPLTSSTLQRLTGMLYGRRDDIQRETSLDLDSVGVGGEGIDVVASDIALNLLLYNDCVIIVEAGGIHVSSPIACTRWDLPSFATIRSQREAAATGPADDQEVEDVWTVYRPQGFEVYAQQKGPDGKARDVLVDSGSWSDVDQDQVFRLRQEPTAPVLRPEMPWPRALGAAVARAHRAIYRAESRADAAELEAVASTKIQAAVGADEDLAERFAKALKENRSFVPYSVEHGEHLPLALPVGPAEQLRSTIEEKEQRLYQVLGLTMAANAERSATEAMLDVSTGIATTLSTLADKMADIERDMLQLLAQAQDTTTLGRPPEIRIEYPTDFAQIDLTDNNDS